MKPKVIEFLTLKQVAEIVSKDSGEPMSPITLRKICRDTAEGKLKPPYALEAELKGKTWLVRSDKVKNFERAPRGPKGPRGAKKSSLVRRRKRSL